MNSQNADLAVCRSVLPFATRTARERHVTAVFDVDERAILALQAVAGLGSTVLASIEMNLLAHGQSHWPEPQMICHDLALVAPMSNLIPPVLLETTGRHGAKEFKAVWALDGAGCIVVTDGRARVLSGWTDGVVTALSGNRDQIVMAMVPATTSSQVEIRVASTSATGQADWIALGAGGLPCADWEVVTALALFQGAVYAAKANVRSGFEIWRAPVDPASGAWTCAVPRGGRRYAASPSVSAFAIADDRLFVAATGADRSQLNVGDEYPEILCIDASGIWSLFCGRDRFSPEGLLQSTAPGGPAAAHCAGMSIGGLRSEGGGLVVWLKPLDSEQTSARVLSWHPDAGWNLVRMVSVGDMDVLTLAAPEGGLCMVTTSVEIGADGPAIKPVLIAQS